MTQVKTKYSTQTQAQVKLFEHSKQFRHEVIWIRSERYFVSTCFSTNASIRRSTENLRTNFDPCACACDCGYACVKAVFTVKQKKTIVFALVLAIAHASLMKNSL